jgi:hypothetical protein
MSEPQLIGQSSGILEIRGRLCSDCACQHQQQFDCSVNDASLNDVKAALRAESKARVATLRKATLSQMATYKLDIFFEIAGLDNRITRLER